MEELHFLPLPVERRIRQISLAWVAKYMPTQFHRSGTTFYEVDNAIFGTSIDEVRLRQNTKSPVAVWIKIACQLQNFLGGNINVGWNDSEHHRARVLHIPEDNITDQFDVILCCQTGSRVSEDSGNVNDTQVFLVGS